MNNKRKGTAFEKYIVRRLTEAGCWVHFITSDERGAQPFDIIAVKDGLATAIECKTQDASKRWFPISRLEDNQIMAFEKWLKCGNTEPLIAVEYGSEVKAIKYSDLKKEGKVDLDAL